MSSSNLNNAYDIANQSNPYLETLMKPWDPFRFRLPDMNMTTSRTKSVSITRNFIVRKDEFLLVWTPSNPLFPLRLYARTTASPSFEVGDPNALTGYVYVTTFPLDEDLAQSFSHARIISGGLAVESASRSGGTIDLAGTINAIQFQDRLNLQNLTFNTLPSFKRNDGDCLVQNSVVDGVVALAAPFGNQDFKLVETRNACPLESALFLSQPFTLPATTITPASQINVPLLSTSDGTMPEGIYGRVRVTLKITPHTLLPVGPTDSLLNLIIYAPRLSETDWNSPINVIPTPFACRGSSVGVDIVADVFVDAEIRYIGILWTNVGSTNITPAGTFQNSQTRVELTSWEYYNRGFCDQGAAIAVNGVSPPTANYQGQVISINGKHNLEIVPNTDLARQLQTDYGLLPENPLLTKATEYYIAMGKLKFIYNKKEYDLARTMGVIDRTIQNKTIADSSGIIDGVLGMLRSLQPVVSKLPVLGPIADVILGANSGSSSGVWRAAESSGVYSRASGMQARAPERGPRIGYSAPLNIDQEQVDMIANSKFDYKEFSVPDSEYETLNAFMTDAFIQDAASTALLNYAGPRGIIDQVAYTFISNRFPVVHKTGVVVGQAITSSVPLVPTYLNVRYILSTGVEGSINVISNATLNESAMYAVCTAAALSGFTDDQFLHVVLNETDIDFTDLEGPSLGLAVLTSMLRRNTRALLTGYVNEKGTLVAVGEVGKKVTLAQRLGTTLIAPYNAYYSKENAPVDLIDHYNKGLIYGPSEAQLGDWTARDRNPLLIFPNDLGSAMLNVIISMNALSKNYKPGGFVKLIDFALNESTNVIRPVVKESGVRYNNKDYTIDEFTAYINEYGKGDDRKYYDKYKPIAVLDGKAKNAFELLADQMTAGQYTKAGNTIDSISSYVNSVSNKRSNGVFDSEGQRLTYQGKPISLEEADKILEKEPGSFKDVRPMIRNGTSLKILAAREAAQGKGKVQAKPNMPKMPTRRGIPRQPVPANKALVETVKAPDVEEEPSFDETAVIEEPEPDLEEEPAPLIKPKRKAIKLEFS